MSPYHVDPKEMAMRQNLDVIASLNMIAEGGPAPTLDEYEIGNEDSPKTDNKTIPFQ